MCPVCVRARRAQCTDPQVRIISKCACVGNRLFVSSALYFYASYMLFNYNFRLCRVSVIVKAKLLRDFIKGLNMKGLPIRGFIAILNLRNSTTSINYVEHSLKLNHRCS